MIETVEDRLKRARLEEQIRRNRMQALDEAQRLELITQDTAQQRYLDDLDAEVAAIWRSNSNNADAAVSHDAAFASLLIDLSRRRMAVVSPASMVCPSSATSAAKAKDSARCRSDDSSLDLTNSKSVSAIKSDDTTNSFQFTEAQILREFGDRVESVEFVTRSGGDEFRTTLWLRADGQVAHG